VTSRPGTPSPGLLRRGGKAIVEVLPAWITARVLVLGALALAHLIVSRTHPSTPGVAARVHTGLLGWDAGWYESIARYGYVPLGHPSFRFFPLVPVVTRALALLPGVSDGAALLGVANGSALLATALLAVLVRRETGDATLARRTIWLLSLAPPAFVLVMGYAEATLLLFVVACFLCIRPRGGAAPAWWWAAVFGVAAGLTRPLGVVLVGSAVAVVAPLAGMAAFLVWSELAVSNFLLPLRVQTSAGLHGGLSDPATTLVHDAKGVLHHHFGTALHVPWILLVLVLVVLALRRFPASYGVFAAGVVLAALSGTNLDSFERYALSAFPLVMAASTLTGRREVERAVLALSAAGMVVYALLAFLNISVP
jgi:hypothetical protein